jgi:phosphatidylserine/phosphatidylglycerophosphate/cardiolipin synthase-like enzyme
LIIRVIATAKISIRLEGFAFSSPVIAAALISAKERIVDVQVVVDRRHNVDKDDKGISRKALALLVVWSDPPLAAAYLQHWESRLKAGMDYHMQK